MTQDKIRSVSFRSRLAESAHRYARRLGVNDGEVPTRQVGVTELHDAAPAAVAAGVVGTLLGRRLIDVGLRELDVSADHPWLRPASYATGAIAGVAAILAARHAGTWWLLPATLVWAYSLAAAAVCDALTQRVPTPLVRQATAVTGVLILAASALSGHWRLAVFAAIAAAVAALIFLVCWRFLGAGFGDVRIAVLGGVGLARPTDLGITLAIAAFIVITLGQAATTLARGGDRDTHFPYGPAIAAAFLIAAVA